MRQQTIISDFAAAVREKERLAAGCTAGAWELVPYETAGVSGTMLMASGETWPEPVTVDPGLSGWYRIRVCMADFGGGMEKNHIDLSLSGDEFSRSVRAADMGPFVNWALDERVEESFWRCADMTGRRVRIEKVRDGLPHTANLLWLRFEPMDGPPEESAAERTVFAHMDGDFHMCDAARSPRDYCRTLYALRGSGVGILSQEVTNDIVDWDAPEPENWVPRAAWTRTRMDYSRRLWKDRDTAYAGEIAYAHACGIELFAGHRMQLSNFTFPSAQPMFALPFVTAHPELRCRTRDGRPCEFLSYAYPETQDFVIGMLLESARHGFDGVHLIFTRGQHLLFEEAAAARYREMFPGEPPMERLPAGDPRLLALRSEIMTGFLARLRQALDGYAREHGTKPLKVYITGYFSVEESLGDGLDIGRFAREGLIDGVIQSNMSVWEETDDVLGPDGLVDLTAYARKAEDRYVYKRAFGNDVPRTAAGAAGYRAVADRYGIAFYSELPWESTVQPEAYIRAAHEIRAAGGDRIAL